MSGNGGRRAHAPTVRFWIALGTWLAAALAVSTPVVPFAWRPQPLVLGLPPSIFWLSLWLAIIFVLVLFLYRTEPETGVDDGEQPSERSGTEGA